MDIFKEDVNRELARIKEKIDLNLSLNEEDLKVLLLSGFFEEDLHESN